MGFHLGTWVFFFSSSFFFPILSPLVEHAAEDGGKGQTHKGLPLPSTTTTSPRPLGESSSSSSLSE